MSSGGQRGIDVSGITSMRLQNASDSTTRKQLQLTYQTYASATGANAFMGDQVNNSYSYLRFLQGIKESTGSVNGCSTCAGLPYQYSSNWTFRNKLQ